jgi:hypothetical protein
MAGEAQMTINSLQDIIDDMVAARGGIERFNAAQVLLVRAAARMSAEILRAEAADVSKLVDGLDKLLGQLPEVINAGVERVIPDNASATELMQIYAMMVRDEESWVFSEEYEAAQAVARRARADGDAVLFVRERLTDADFDAWLKLCDESKPADFVSSALYAEEPPEVRPPNYSTRPSVAPAEPSPAPQPVTDAEPVVRPADHNAGSLIVRKPAPPPAEIIPPAPPPPDRPHRDSGRGGSNPFAGRDAMLGNRATMPSGGFPAPPAAMPRGFAAPTATPGRWGGRGR